MFNLKTVFIRKTRLLRPPHHWLLHPAALVEHGKKLHKTKWFSLTGHKQIFNLVQTPLDAGHLYDPKFCPPNEAKSTVEGL